MLNLLALAIMAQPSSFFRIVHEGSKFTFLEPAGRPFWSLGVCCVNEGATAETYDPKNPGYAGFRLFKTEQEWAVDTLKHLRLWGFNTIGGWSNIGLLRKYDKDHYFPYTVVLHLGAYYRAPWEDIFNPEFEKVCDAAARDQIVPIVNDPMLIGYFSDNELGWWDDSLFLSYFALPASSPGKKKLLSIMRAHYSSDFGSFKRDWESDAASFDDLAKEGTKLFIRPGGNGMQLIDKWTYALASRYYQTVRACIRKCDKNRLILGDRYAQHWDSSILKAARRHVDVVSTNYGAEFLDGTLSRYFLDTIHQITKKPVLISEFYWSAMENRSGNKNSVKAFPIVNTQEERAKALAVNLQELLSRPYVIGAHWFQFYDEPTNGRSDGEDNNMGLVDIEGRPYERVVDTFKSLAKQMNTRRAKTFKSCRVIPNAPNETLKGLTSWPRNSGWIRPTTKEAFADLYVCRDEKRIYLGIQMMDFIDSKLYRDGIVPESERPCFELKLGTGESYILRFAGYKNPTVVTGNNVIVSEQTGMKHTIIFGIDWPHESSEGTRSFTLTATLKQHSRASSMSWKTNLRFEP